MVMIIINLSYITCLVTNDAWHAYDVIGVYKIHHGVERFSYFAEPEILWLAGRVMGEVGARKNLTELAILWLASTVMGEVEAITRKVGHAPLANRSIPLLRKLLCLLINRPT